MTIDILPVEANNPPDEVDHDEAAETAAQPADNPSPHTPEAPEGQAAPKKRGRGRPPGAKNKPKVPKPAMRELAQEEEESPPPPPSPRTQRRLAISQAAELRRQQYERRQRHYLDLLSAELFLTNI